MKKNTNTQQVIATTPLQSQLLISAGLPENTADMRWNLSVTFWGEPILESIPMTQAELRYDQDVTGPYVFKPAWSIGALIRISGVNICTSDPVKLREYLVDAICQQLENGGGNNPQSQSREG